MKIGVGKTQRTERAGMPTKDAAQRSFAWRLARALVILGVGVSLGAAIKLAGGAAIASHPKGPPHSHVISMNTAGDLETFCAYALDDSMSQSVALTKINAALLGPAANPWELVGGVDFSAEVAPCVDNPASMRLRIYFYTDNDIWWAPACYGSQDLAGCASPIPPMAYDFDSNHFEYQTFEVELDTDPLKGEHSRRLVNHEVGHVLGLANDENDTRCESPSIMHGPNLAELCSNDPTTADLVGVALLTPADSSGSGAGGGCAAGKCGF
jgi:hypothetical protein